MPKKIPTMIPSAEERAQTIPHIKDQDKYGNFGWVKEAAIPIENAFRDGALAECERIRAMFSDPMVTAAVQSAVMGVRGWVTDDLNVNVARNIADAALRALTAKLGVG
jgi:hypothetical protein